MKPFLKFVLIFGGILLASAFLAPILFDFLPFKFERIFHRLVMIFSLAALFLFVRINRETFKRYGLDWRSESKQYFLKGFVAGILVLAALVTVKVLGGETHWSPKPFQFSTYAGVMIKGLLTGIVVALIEEFFFRGFIYNWLKERWQWNVLLSMVITSFFYSIIHFVSGHDPFIGPDPQFRDSFTLMAAPFISLMDWKAIAPHAFGLFLFGMVLNLWVIRTGSLYPSIGLHAGCVFFVKTDALFVENLERNPFLWSSAQMVDGVLGWSFLILLGFVIFLFQKKKDFVTS